MPTGGPLQVTCATSVRLLSAVPSSEPSPVTNMNISGSTLVLDTSLATLINCLPDHMFSTVCVVGRDVMVMYVHPPVVEKHGLLGLPMFTAMLMLIT